MAIKEIKQNNFSGGLTENIRDTSGNKVWYTDSIQLEAGRLSQSPILSKAVSNYSTAYRIIKLLQVGTTTYGLGQDNTTDKKTVLYEKLIGTDNNFTARTPATSYALEATDPFFIYENGKVYFLNGQYISEYNVSTNGIDYDWVNLSGATTNNKLFGGTAWRGDLYGYSGQNIYKVTTAGVVTDMLTITSGQSIRQLVAYGNYFLIFCSASFGVSQMYIWDGVTTTNFADIVKIGTGQVIGGELKDGEIHAVLLKREFELNVLKYTGGIFKIVKTYNAKQNRAGTYQYLKRMNMVKSFGDGIYFMLQGTKADSTLATFSEAQVFLYTDNSLPQDSLYCIDSLDSTVTDANVLSSIGDVILSENTTVSNRYHTIAVLDRLSGVDTSQFYESTDNAYSNTAIIETVKHSCGEPNAYKQLKAVALTYDPLPTAGSVVLKYRKDEETTWTTIFTDTTDNAVSHATPVIEATGANLPTFKEIQFRIELSGNAKLTGYKFKYEELTEENY